MNALDSCDSSNPVWMAICGHRYTPNSDSLLQVSKVKKEVDFNYPMTEDQTTLNNIRNNIDLTHQCMRDAWNSRYEQMTDEEK